MGTFTSYLENFNKYSLLDFRGGHAAMEICRQMTWMGGMLSRPIPKIKQYKTHGSNTSCMLFQIAFPPMIIVSCVVSSRRQPPGSHWNFKKKILFKFYMGLT